MAEYYERVNIDKNEFISPYDFNYGNKCYESSYKNNTFLNALYTLLNNEWKRDRIIWLSDDVSRTTPYKNVSSTFKESETIIREEIETYLKYPYGDNDYGIDIKNPYHNMFTKTTETFQYIINQTKQVYYSINEIIVIRHNEFITNMDPLPSLMKRDRNGDIGKWVGDIVKVSHVPPKDYLLLTEIEIEN